MRKYGGILLAGGKSTRLGDSRDKATELLGGKILLQWAIELLSDFADEILVVGRNAEDMKGFNPDKQSKSIRFVEDIDKDKGPLGGIYTGLFSSQYDRNYVIACDMPFLTVDLLESLQGADEGQDAVFLTVGGRFQPLVGIYDKSCLDTLKKSIDDGDLAVHRFLDKIITARIEIENDDSLADIDSPDDLVAARRRLEK